MIQSWAYGSYEYSSLFQKVWHNFKGGFGFGFEVFGCVFVLFFVWVVLVFVFWFFVVLFFFLVNIGEVIQ